MCESYREWSCFSLSSSECAPEQDARGWSAKCPGKHQNTKGNKRQPCNPVKGAQRVWESKREERASKLSQGQRRKMRSRHSEGADGLEEVPTCRAPNDTVKFSCAGKLWSYKGTDPMPIFLAGTHWDFPVAATTENLLCSPSSGVRRPAPHAMGWVRMISSIGWDCWLKHGVRSGDQSCGAGKSWWEHTLGRVDGQLCSSWVACWWRNFYASKIHLLGEYECEWHWVKLSKAELWAEMCGRR